MMSEPRGARRWAAARPSARSASRRRRPAAAVAPKPPAQRSRAELAQGGARPRGGTAARRAARRRRSQVPTRLATSTTPRARSVGEQRRAVAPGQHRQHRGQRALGEELLAAEDDDEEADAVAEAGDQRAARATSGRPPAAGACGHEREAHRQAGGEARPGQRAGRSGSARSSPSSRTISWITSARGAACVAAWSCSPLSRCGELAPASWFMSPAVMGRRVNADGAGPFLPGCRAAPR